MLGQGGREIVSAHTVACYGGGLRLQIGQLFARHDTAATAGNADKKYGLLRYLSIHFNYSLRNLMQLCYF